MAIQNVTGGAGQIAGIGQNAVNRTVRNTQQDQNAAPAAQGQSAAGPASTLGIAGGQPPQNRLDQAVTAQTTPPPTTQGLQAPGGPVEQIETRTPERASIEALRRNTGADTSAALTDVASEQGGEPLPLAPTPQSNIIEQPQANSANESVERTTVAQIEGQEEGNARDAIGQNAGGPGVVQEFQRTEQAPTIGERIDITA